MKNPLIKICGITSEEEIRYIAKAGIDYAGFVLFFPKSKRNLSLECAKKLMRNFRQALFRLRLR